MQPRPNIFTINNWAFNPSKRSHRFRCQVCSRLIEDGSTLTVERRGKASHGYHAECFNSSLAGQAALARENDRQS